MKINKELLPVNNLLGSLSWGVNQTGIFLALCRAYSSLKLDIIDVDSHVIKGWFAKIIIARNKNEEGLNLIKFNREIQKISNTFNFSSRTFTLPEYNRPSELPASIMIVIHSDNKVGLLADLLERLSKYGIDIIDIDIQMENNEKSFAMNIHTNINSTMDDYFVHLEKIRAELKSLKKSSGFNHFNYLIHSIETFNYMHKIDYETDI